MLLKLRVELIVVVIAILLVNGICQASSEQPVMTQGSYQSNIQSTSLGPISPGGPGSTLIPVEPIKEQGTAGQAGTTSQAGTSGLIGPVYPAGTITINFDDLVTGGAGGGGAILVTNQYASHGVTFSGARAVDYSKGLAIPGFTHSGNIAIEACYGAELCTDPIEMVFNQPISSIKVWVGIDTQSTAKQRYVVELSAFDATGQQVAYNYAVLNAITGSVPIQTPLQVSGSNIVRATVSYAPPSPPYNSGLAIDDVEFFSRIGVSGAKTTL